MNTDIFAAISGLNDSEKAALSEILRNQSIMQMAQEIAAKCYQNNPPQELEIFPESAELAQSWFAAAYLSMDYSRNKFRKLGFPEAVWLDTMSDMVIWLRHEKRNYGVYGLGKVARLWTAFLYNGNVIRRGRLECNTEYYFKANADGKNHLLPAPGAPVINLHIPEDGPLDIRLCSQSLKMMAEFFAECKRDYNWQGAICQSWLLDRQLGCMLTEDSNIIKFQQLGIHYSVDEKADTVFRIFGAQDPFTVKNPTTLQRKAAAFLRQGGVFREEGLFIPRSKLEAVDFNLEKLHCS